MNRKKIARYLIFAAVTLLSTYTEKRMGIYSFSVPVLVVLIYCKQNIPTCCLLYAGASCLITPTLNNLLFAFVPVAVTIVTSFVLFRTKRKASPLILLTEVFLSLSPRVFTDSQDVYSIANTVISIVGALLFTYCVLSFAEPLLVKKKPIRESEAVAFLIALGVAFLGLSFFSPFGVKTFWFFFVLATLLCLRAAPRLTLAVALSAGLGGAIGQLSPQLFALCGGMGLAAVSFKNAHRIFQVVAALLAMLCLSVLFSIPITLQMHLPAAVAGAFVVALPRRYLHVYEVGSAAKVAPRTVVNRDRKELSARLQTISKVFYEMQDILRLDLKSATKQCDRKKISLEVCEKCCSDCTNITRCASAYGTNSYIAENLAMCAMDNGKVTLLDVPSIVTRGCKKINLLIAAANESTAKLKRRKEIESDIEQGREMVIEQMGGVGLLLARLGEELRERVSYDTELEEGIASALAREDIIAEEVIVYGKKDRAEKVLLAVRESEVEGNKLCNTVGGCLGYYMEEIQRENIGNGRICVWLAPSQRLQLVYGEAAVSKERLCGDNREVVRLDESRLMMILSDGMGTGDAAYKTSMNAILMIESFYRAGFDHNTVLSCVGRLLCLREQDDFSALDVIIADTKNATADFIKQGGRESFVLSDGIVEVVECGSLPLGMLEESAPLIERRKVKENDIVVLASDGVTDALGIDTIKEILLTANTLNPQMIAELLVNNAVKCGEEKGVSDDATCLVGRFVAK